MEQTNLYRGTGRRKDASARVQMVPGSGKITINGKPLDDYFHGLDRHKKQVLKPLEVYAASNQYDYLVTATGGGITGQAGAVRHGIARAILQLDPTTKQVLRKEELLTRDPRMVERKKSGQPKARKRFQFSKR
jgi:small subunit ribosomal protein S9